ncbi:hypothetical protein [Demequina activiva]|uniref:DUF4232 domain-containing protein n=1 Tax=Demequina activiva TaxID=1582364 RepID=A0A919Q2G5_9MICO|nr:hypothetical protein [Demequina activiva]GIG55012.1 hypothetical protein Dac01nite_17640 [Demequina activiva]
MDGLRRPVGEQPAQVYWVRRALVLLAAVVLVGALWFIVSSLVSSGGEEDPAAPASTEPDSTVSPAAQSTAADDPSRACTAEDVTVSAVASPTQVNVGSMPAFEVSVEHTGASPCSLSSNGEGTALVVRSGTDVYYDSAWCPDQPVFTDADWILQEGAREALQATWTGQRYNEACEPGDVAPAGYFVAEIAVGGVSAGETQFQMVE